MNDTQDLITPGNKLFQKLLLHQKLLLLLATLILLTVPLFLFNTPQPLLRGPESYYHLLQAAEIDLLEWMYYPLHLASSLPQILLVLPLLLGISFTVLFLYFARRVDISPQFTFFFLLFLFLSPSFIYSYTTISAHSFFIVLALASLVLLLSPKKYFRYAAIVPLLAATHIDIFSSLLLFAMIIIVALHLKEKRKEITILVALPLLIAIVNALLLNQPLMQGPFHQENHLVDLLSDFGGLKGISIFTFLLALIGAALTWKKKSYVFLSIFIPFLMLGYIYNTEITLYIAILTSAFAAIAFVKIFERQWKIPNLKQVTFLLLLLGIMFTTLSFYDRISLVGPSTEDAAALTWLKENNDDEGIIFSIPENSYAIEYFSGYPALYYYHNQQHYEAYQAILNATYITELFPLLEENNISIIYINSKVQQQFPADQGLLFLLKNERFKMIHSQNQTQVWMFQEE